MFGKRVWKITLCCLLFIQIQGTEYTGETQDQTSPRTNTLFDDADDIQRQLDNEARDRIKFGRPKTIWVFHFPTHFPGQSSMQSPIEEQLLRRPREALFKRKKDLDNEMLENEEMMFQVTPPLPPYKEWDYGNQGEWAKQFPDCGGRSQSPVDLPVAGLLQARGARNLLFQNFDVKPKSLTLVNDGRRVMLFGEWKSDKRPLMYGGAAHARRYLFHSLTLHVPSEHTVGGFIYPIESQVLFVSAEYENMDEAIDTTSDPQAFLIVTNIYKYGNTTQPGLQDIIVAAKGGGVRNASLAQKPLKHFLPPFSEYACYQGSIPVPPCTETVLWLIRGRTMSVAREYANAAQRLLISEGEPKHLLSRSVQPLNDRKVYLFK